MSQCYASVTIGSHKLYLYLDIENQKTYEAMGFSKMNYYDIVSKMNKDLRQIFHLDESKVPPVYKCFYSSDIISPNFSQIDFWSYTVNEDDYVLDKYEEDFLHDTID